MLRNKKVAKRKANAHKLPESIPAGEIFIDLYKRKWKLDKSVGVGGFGEIYGATDDINAATTSDPLYVIKVEPHTNGPLFTEIHFYHKVAKPDQISAWMDKNKFKFLGMPKFIGSGSHVFNGAKYRFMVMERFGDDLQKHFLANGKKLSLKTILTIGIKMLNVLEYIHHFGYVHADIKASNILLGYRDKSLEKAYLVDYGLACKYMTSGGSHKKYAPDPKKAHDGTIEFTSRDAHVGLFSRRGDLEILGYNMLYWLTSYLPWESKIANVETVKNLKNTYMDDIPKLISDCFKNTPSCAAIREYLEYVAKLDFEEDPDYDKCRRLLRNGLRAAGLKDDFKIELKTTIKTETPKKLVRGRKNAVEKENVKGEMLMAKRNIRSHSESNGSSQLSSVKKQKKQLDSGMFSNPTPAMLNVIERKQQKLNATPIRKTKLRRSPRIHGIVKKRLPRSNEISPDLF